MVLALLSQGPDPSRFLDALEPQLRPGDAVYVVGRELREVPAWALPIAAGDRALVPELWAAGLDRAETPIVALTNSAMVPDPGWMDGVRHLACSSAVGLGGAIEPGPALGYADWAYYFCRYAPYLRPLEAEGIEIAADNAAYRREVLVEYRETWDRGFWEPFVHRALERDGHRLGLDPDMVVRLSPGVAHGFRRQRFRHGREHGRSRSAGSGRAAVLLAAMTAPAVPWLLVARIARQVASKERERVRFLIGLPLVLWFSCWWALGELVGRLDVVAARPSSPARPC